MLLLALLAAASADEEMVVEDEAAAPDEDPADRGAAGSPDDDSDGGAAPDVDYEEMMRNMGGGMGGMGGMNNNPYMEKLRRENPELFAGMNMDVSLARSALEQTALPPPSRSACRWAGSCLL